MFCSSLKQRSLACNEEVQSTSVHSFKRCGLNARACSLRPCLKRPLAATFEPPPWFWAQQCTTMRVAEHEGLFCLRHVAAKFAPVLATPRALCEGVDRAVTGQPLVPEGQQGAIFGPGTNMQNQPAGPGRFALDRGPLPPGRDPNQEQTPSSSRGENATKRHTLTFHRNRAAVAVVHGRDELLVRRRKIGQI